MWSCVILLRLLCEMMFQPESLNANRQKSPAAFVHNPGCMCTTAHPLQIHTPLQTCTFYVSECVCFLSPGPHCIKVRCSSATESHTIILLSLQLQGVSFSKKTPWLSCSFSQQTPPPVLLQHLLPFYLLLPKPQLTKPSRADVRVLRCACQ